MKTILKRIGVCIAGFIFGIILTILTILLIAKINRSNSLPVSVVVSPAACLQGIEGYNSQFKQFVNERNRKFTSQSLIDKVISVNIDECNKLKNGEKNIIYISAKGNVSLVVNGNIPFEQSTEKDKIYTEKDLRDLKNLIGCSNNIYAISIVDYYEDGCIKEMLIEAKEK